MNIRKLWIYFIAGLLFGLVFYLSYGLSKNNFDLSLFIISMSLGVVFAVIFGSLFNLFIKDNFNSNFYSQKKDKMLEGYETKNKINNYLAKFKGLTKIGSGKKISITQVNIYLFYSFFKFTFINLKKVINYEIKYNEIKEIKVEKGLLIIILNNDGKNVFVFKNQNDYESIINVYNELKSAYGQDNYEMAELYDLWSNYKVGEPINSLIYYDTEILNGGHLQFFENIKNDDKIFEFILNNIPEILKDNFIEAYELYRSIQYKNNDMENSLEDLFEFNFEKFDDFYMENRSQIKNIFFKYLKSLKK